MAPVKHIVPPPGLLEQRPWNRPWLWIAMAASIIALDLVTPPNVLLPVFFIFPVGLTAWHRGRGWGIFAAVSLTAIRFATTYRWGFPNGFAITCTNALLRGASLFVLAMITARVSRQLAVLRRKLGEFEGIVPICAFCKDIRDGEGAWHRLEHYVSSHSDARFSHGICPGCSKQQYNKFRIKTAAAV